MATVWSDGWQLQCCGGEWLTGDRVTWTASSSVDWDFLDAVAGGHADGVTLAQESHQEDLVDTTVVGVVSQIRAISCAYAPASSNVPGTLYPVRGTTVVKSVVTAMRWHRSPHAELEFVGFLTTIELQDG